MSILLLNIQGEGDKAKSYEGWGSDEIPKREWRPSNTLTKAELNGLVVIMTIWPC